MLARDRHHHRLALSASGAPESVGAGWYVLRWWRGKLGFNPGISTHTRDRLPVGTA